MVIATAYRSTVNCLLVSNRFTVYRFPRPIPNTVLRLLFHRLPFPVPPSEHRLPSTVHRQLVAYFRSGWAFLIPLPLFRESEN